MPIGTELTVRSKLPTRQSTTEARFEKRVASCLAELGLMSYHTSEKYYAGIPDRYVVGGNWIEFKILPCGGRRSVSPRSKFKPQQKQYLSKFHENGDRTWACIMFQPKHGEAYIVLVPWHRMQSQWTRLDWQRLGVKADGGDLLGYFQKFFGPWYDRFSNGNEYGAVKVKCR